MPLVSNYPQYKLKLPILKKTVTYRPFTVRQERILMLAGNGDETDMFDATVSVIKDCLYDDIDVDKLPLAELELLLLNLRAKSVGEKINLQMKDPENPSSIYDASINVTDIKVTIPKSYQDKITLGDGTVVIMLIPSAASMKSVDVTGDDINDAISFAMVSIKQVIQGDEAISRADLSDDELRDWLEGLTTADFTLFRAFFDSLPRLSHTFTIKRKDGTEFESVIEGLASFFN
tara:strand:- start:1202 stop:1900 length:699 start_codon:yes stop_codon:yes gene_type:complete